MEKIIPISDLQSKAKRIVEQVRDGGDAVVITQRGRPAAVLVDFETYEGLVATLDEMSFPDWKVRLREARRASAAGEGIELGAYLRKRRKRA
jgi:prevent-host-death family protein